MRLSLLSIRQYTAHGAPAAALLFQAREKKRLQLHSLSRAVFGRLDKVGTPPRVVRCLALPATFECREDSRRETDIFSYSRAERRTWYLRIEPCQQHRSGLPAIFVRFINSSSKTLARARSLARSVSLSKEFTVFYFFCLSLSQFLNDLNNTTQFT